MDGWMGDLPKGEKSARPMGSQADTLGPEDVANVVLIYAAIGSLEGIGHLFRNKVCYIFRIDCRGTISVPCAHETGGPAIFAHVS